MTVLVILAILFGVLAIGSFITAFAVPSYPTWRWQAAITVGALSVFIAIILGGAITTVAQDNYNYETVHICSEKGGVVSKDNHCFVDDKPVEFAPGVWQR